MVRKEATMSEEQVTQSGGSEQAAKTILVVDDQESTRMLIRAAAEGMPFPCRVVEALDGQAAVKVAREEKPDLALLDIVLPGSTTSGVLICNSLCREGLKVVIVSGQASKAIVQACLSSGAVDYLGKPFSVDTLRDKLAKWLGVAAPAALGRGRESRGVVTPPRRGRSRRRPRCQRPWCPA